MSRCVYRAFKSFLTETIYNSSRAHYRTETETELSNSTAQTVLLSFLFEHFFFLFFFLCFLFLSLLGFHLFKAFLRVSCELICLFSSSGFTFSCPAVITTRIVFDPMEGLESVYAQAMYGMTRESKIMEHHQGSDLIWGGNELMARELCSSSSFNHQLINPNLSSCFMSDLGVIGEIQQQQHVGNRASSIDPSSLDCLLSATSNSNNTSTEDDEGISVLFSDCQTLWSFGGVSSAESENREVTNETTTTIKPKSLKRNRGGDGGTTETTTTTTTKPKYVKRNRGDETGSHFSLLHPQDDSEKGGFKLIYDENQSKSKKPRTEKERGGSSNISFQHSTCLSDNVEPDAEAIAQMKEMIYRAAAFRPVNFGLEIVEKPKRKNVKISTDPQTVAARQRRERISEKIRVLQTLVPGGTKMDTASMLDEAANYLKFLRAQVKALENLRPKLDQTNLSFSSAPSFPLFHPSFLPLQNPNQIHHPGC